MDLTAINGLGPARQDKLADAGVTSLEDLAEATPAELAESVEITDSVLEGFVGQAADLVELSEVEGIGEASLEALVAEGVRSVGDLQARDAETLAEAIGRSPGVVEGWQDAGEGSAEPESAEHARELAAGAAEAGSLALKGLDEARVVLEEGITDAKVKFEDDVLAEARILPVKAKDDVEEMLEDLKGNVVVLREKADTAMVRVEDDVVEGIPIFKEKVAEAGQSAAEGVQEVRVRVQEIRDKRVLPEAEKITDKIKSLFPGD